MPAIKLNDNFGLSLEFVPAESGGFGKYLRDPMLLRAAAADLGRLGALTLREVNVAQVSFGFHAEQDAGLGKVGLTFGGGAGGGLQLFREAAAIVAEAGYDRDSRTGEPKPVTVPDGMAWLKNQFVLTASAAVGVPAGNLQAGFEAEGSVTLANFFLFPVDHPFGKALETAFTQFTIPREFADLEKMPAGRIATMGGMGSLQISVSATLPVTANPLVLAGAALPVVNRPIEVRAGADLTVGVSVRLQGEYEIRVARQDEQTLVLGYFKRNTKERSLSVAGAIGLSAQVGDRDLVSTLIGALSTNPEKDLQLLPESASGVAGPLAEALQEGVRRRLEIAVSAELGRMSSREAAFLFEITPAACSEESRRLITQALRGDLTGMAGTHAGIRPVRSVFTHIQEKRTALRINLLGIYNYISLSTLAVEGEMLFEEATGQLVITDKVTAQRLRAGVDTFRADGHVLRSALMDSFQATVAYRSGGLLANAPELEVANTYFELLRNTSRQELKDNLDVGEALGLLTQPDKEAILSASGGFGRTALYVETRYGPEAAMRLFLAGDPPSAARPEEDFTRAGRNAVTLLIQRGDEFDYRRQIANDAVWSACRRLGNANAIAGQLRNAAIQTEHQAAVVASDYLLIQFWADTMAAASRELAAMRKFIRENPQIDLEGKQFRKQREQVTAQLARAAEKTKARWGEPWGLVAMTQLLEEPVQASLQIIGPALDLDFQRPAARRQSG